jgi:hypothetical protein
MRAIAAIFALICLTACNPASTSDSAPLPDFEPAVNEADRGTAMAALDLTPNDEGKVLNECGDMVTPTIAPAELGGAVGTALLVAIPGGPSLYSCYGDGPDLHLLMRDGDSFREIYAARGRVLIILPQETEGVRDIADGGPGFEFPLWQWNGETYAFAGRTISDAELGDATALP